MNKKHVHWGHTPTRLPDRNEFFTGLTKRDVAEMHRLAKTKDVKLDSYKDGLHGNAIWAVKIKEGKRRRR